MAIIALNVWIIYLGISPPPPHHNLNHSQFPFVASWWPKSALWQSYRDIQGIHICTQSAASAWWLGAIQSQQHTSHQSGLPDHQACVSGVNSMTEAEYTSLYCGC